ncbi:TonB-dependent receptor [Lacihabitans sp. LS3-19]|uniref:TonB-dependent receptor n=1 Tax=Lacihabitans sp. LS3-19 TaxID=2487335 RepID=UPI00286DD26C|nr:TonB-dependent receptor [Lacihabitans sp. LS3-19]MCP9769551.1 TonB-dependent receptor [Lacihabitans sp. LS3-19]
MKKYIFAFLMPLSCIAQFELSGKIKNKNQVLPGAIIKIEKSDFLKMSDEEGYFSFKTVPKGKIELTVSYISMKTKKLKLEIIGNKYIEIDLEEDNQTLDEVVISGNLKEMSKSESPIAIEIYKPAFFAKNPSANIFEALQGVNGLRPQVNCNICNTGDIHINGMEGPYTLILIDGMPIVSSLSSVYGLMGIPNSLIERVEVVKGPASTLYGSEAVGGLINIITKTPLKSPKLSFDAFTTSWGEINNDWGFRYKIGKFSALVGINMFNYQNIKDKNTDGFTDLSLQKRLSVFNKFQYSSGSVFLRFSGENRWGGETNWDKKYRGTDQVYGESIITKRAELIGNQKLAEHLSIGYSLVYHLQDSYYGETPLLGKQTTAFSQLIYSKKKNKQDWLVGLPFKYNYYDDNTILTKTAPISQFTPGLFVQNEAAITTKLKTSMGARLDIQKNHGMIFTPRLAIKWDNSLRLNIGKGYRIVNVFAEEHAAMTGAKEIIIEENLKPEESWNANLNWNEKIALKNGFIGIEVSGFYTYFSNKILPNYDRHPDKIYYNNLDGYLTSKGLSLSLDLNLENSLKVQVSGTLLDVKKYENKQTARPYFTEKYSAKISASYDIPELNTTIDFTSNITGPLLLPLQNELDPRPGSSPWTLIHNVQFSKKILKNAKLYGGVKNLGNFLPYKNLPFIIAGAKDPFDKNVTYDNSGLPISTESNPYALNFDPTYVYTSLQGRRAYLGLKFEIK